MRTRNAQKVNDFVYNRENIYEYVWLELIEIVAGNYGVSKTTISSNCKKLKAPIPHGSYWIKEENGQTSQKKKLPRFENLPIILIYPGVKIK
jgi:hypothetical protein